MHVHNYFQTPSSFKNILTEKVNLGANVRLHFQNDPTHQDLKKLQVEIIVS